MQRRITQSEEQDDVHYASVHFSKNQTDPIYSNITTAGAQRHEDKEEDKYVEYAAVQFKSTASRWAALLTASMPTFKPQHIIHLEELAGCILHAPVCYIGLFCLHLYYHCRTVVYISWFPPYFCLRTTGQQTVEDPAALYSTVNKISWIQQECIIYVHFIFFIFNYMFQRHLCSINELGNK